jgi:hypothetical protein
MRKLTSLLFLSLAMLSCTTDETPWPQTTSEMRPWVRWWWMGSAVDEPNLKAEMVKYAQKGIGGVEITPIYGAKGFEDKYIPFLSEQWMKMLDVTLRTADSLGMGVDMNTGTGWPFGGPHVELPQAASRIIVQKYEVKPGRPIAEAIVVSNPKQALGATIDAVTAYGPNGEVLLLTDKVNAEGRLDWVPETGSWTVYVAFCAKTLQQVKRSAPGGEGYTFDHLSADALKSYLSRFDNAFGEKKYPVRCFFNDSYEVFGASWSPVLFNEFEKRRGYDLRKFLRELNGDGDDQTVARIKSDYRQTMGDLVHDNFTVGWTNWAHGRNAKTRNQSHGSPANVIDLYAMVDIPEIETFGGGDFPIQGFRRDSADVKYADTDPLFQKFASSGAHTTGKNLVSCETFTWLREHFKGNLAHCKPELDQLFVSGVNHVFFHGTTYSPQEAGWPGWLFYASTQFIPNNPSWDHLDGFSDYITRCQSVLQAGTHDNDVLVYWPVFDQWHDAKGFEKQFTVHNADRWLHLKPVRELLAKGYCFDFVSDKQIEAITYNNGLVTHAAVKPYQTIVVPECGMMPLETLQKLVALANQGARVVFEKMPLDVPGYGNLEQRRAGFAQLLESLRFDAVSFGQIASVGKGEVVLTNQLQQAIERAGAKRETLTDLGLQFNRRRLADGYYYFLTNLTANNIDAMVPLVRSGTQVAIMQPMTGDFGLAQSLLGDAGLSVRVQLKSGESCILKIAGDVGKMAPWPYREQTASLSINGPWSLEFLKGGPILPKPLQLDSLAYWTSLGNADFDNFAGTAAYSTSFTIDGPMLPEYLLKLPNLRESARVFVNGHEVGVVWGLPYEIKVGNYLKKGENQLRIEVANLMANRIRYMDQNAMPWRIFHEINFVNIAYKKFDASSWAVLPAGLAGPVTLVGFQ